jgi:Zn-dependent metalloprotease
MALVQAAQLGDARKIAEDFFKRAEVKEAFLMQVLASEVRAVSVREDPNISGITLVRVQQFIQNVRVYGAEALVSVKPSLGVMSVQSTLAPAPPTVSITPAVTSEQAVSAARQDYNSIVSRRPAQAGPEPVVTMHEGRVSATSELVLVRPETLQIEGTSLRLVWQIRIPPFVFFIDAKSGKVLFRYKNQPTALSRTTFDLNDTSGGCADGQVVIRETGPVVPSPSSQALSAHDYAGRTYNYYYSTFQRDSYDNGASIESHVRVGSFPNALWDPDGKCIVYGEGYATAIDVAAHELTHGVTQFSAGLDYFGESGAANEFFSDFFGEMVKGKSGIQNWLIGENLPGYSSSNPLRNMAAPNLNGFFPDQPFDAVANHGQPDHYSFLVSSATQICASTYLADNGCVHFNSGILNKGAYLAADGSSFHGVTVTGIGRAKLERIVYRTLTAKLTSSTTLSFVAQKVVESCDDLVGTYQITANDCQQVKNAFIDAIGIPTS